MRPIISAIAAISQNRCLGKDNNLIWKIPEDLKRFKALTKNHTVIMGRKTFESIGKALPERTNIVISRNPDFQAQDCVVVKSFEEAITQSGTKDEIFIIGGGQIYEEALPVVNRLYLTIIEKEVQGDAYFPDFSAFSKIIETSEHEYDGLKYKFLVLEK